MTDRKRDPLPQGYQFGDAGRVFGHAAQGKHDVPARFTSVTSMCHPMMSFGVYMTDADRLAEALALPED